jgi:hypothetical protein
VEGGVNRGVEGGVEVGVEVGGEGEDLQDMGQEPPIVTPSAAATAPPTAAAAPAPPTAAAPDVVFEL